MKRNRENRIMRCKRCGFEWSPSYNHGYCTRCYRKEIELAYIKPPLSHRMRASLKRQAVRFPVLFRKTRDFLVEFNDEYGFVIDVMIFLVCVLAIIRVIFYFFFEI